MKIVYMKSIYVVRPSILEDRKIRAIYGYDIFGRAVVIYRLTKHELMEFKKKLMERDYLNINYVNIIDDVIVTITVKQPSNIQFNFKRKGDGWNDIIATYLDPYYKIFDRDFGERILQKLANRNKEFKKWLISEKILGD